MGLDHDSDTVAAVQTEGTNLAMAYEDNPGVSPPSGWMNFEPNSYGQFGAAYTKAARDPISKSLQTRKPMLTDEGTSLSAELDVTYDHIDFLAPAVYRSLTKHNGNTGLSKFRPTEVTSAHYVVPSLGDLDEGFLVYGRGFAVPENNGLHRVGSGSSSTQIKAAGLETEASPPENAVVDFAGFRGGTGDIELDSDGNLTSNGTSPNFTTWGLVPYQGIYIGGASSDNRFATESFYGIARVVKIEANKLTLDKRSWVVEQKASLDLADHAANADTVVQAKLAGPAGNDITVAIIADGAEAEYASLDLDTVTDNVDTVIRAIDPGIAGNDITVSFVADAVSAAGSLEEIGTHVIIHYKATATASTVADIETLIGTSTLIEVLTPGTGATSLDSADAFTGEPLVGGVAADPPSVSEAGDDVTLHITPGYTTVLQLEAVIASQSTKIEVAIEGTPETVLDGTDEFSAESLTGGASGADNGAGKSIDIYFTRHWRNVAMDHSDYRRPSLSAEVELPGADGGTLYMYMLGLMVNNWAWNIPVSAKATINLEMIGRKTFTPTTDRRTGPDDAYDPVSTEGASTATDLARLRLDTIDEEGISTDFTSMTLTTKNAISPEKQLAHLGAKIMNAGKFTQEFDANAIFTSAEVIHAVRCNKTCTADVLIRNPDFGVWVDIQAMTLDEAPLNMEKDKSVKIGSKGMGFMHGHSGSTGSLSMFAYLPPSPADDEEC